jgi:hypothetical protein
MIASHAHYATITALISGTTGDHGFHLAGAIRLIKGAHAVVYRPT